MNDSHMGSIMSSWVGPFAHLPLDQCWKQAQQLEIPGAHKNFGETEITVNTPEE